MTIKNILSVALICLLIVSCNDKKSSQKTTLMDSTGNINHVSVVISNELWNGAIGDAVRNVLATPIYGLPQDEPMFTIAHIPPSVFSGFVTKNRTILVIEPGKDAAVTVKDNVYAQPQKVITISGKSQETIIKELQMNKDEIIRLFRNEEIAERRRQMNLSLHSTKTLQDSLGITVDFPSIYKLIKEDGNFFWYSKDIASSSGSMHLIFYDIPYDAIKKNDSTINQIIKVRDSVGKAEVPGVLEGSYMGTEDAYTPFHDKTEIDGRFAYETKGLWDLKNAFMAGPFLNYTVEDKKNNRWVVAEGFVFAPSVDKRNYMLEVEAILKTLKIQ